MMGAPRLNPDSWRNLRQLIALHGHQNLITALRYDQMVQILGDVPGCEPKGHAHLNPPPNEEDNNYEGDTE